MSEAYDERREVWENMPERLHNLDRGRSVDETISRLEEANDMLSGVNIDDVLAQLERALEAGWDYWGAIGE